MVLSSPVQNPVFYSHSIWVESCDSRGWEETIMCILNRRLATRIRHDNWGCWLIIHHVAVFFHRHKPLFSDLLNQSFTQWLSEIAIISVLWFQNITGLAVSYWINLILEELVQILGCHMPLPSVIACVLKSCSWGALVYNTNVYISDSQMQFEPLFSLALTATAPSSDTLYAELRQTNAGFHCWSVWHFLSWFI